tara:strand:+ start:5320 stop:5502 length:183 start_codon:yes stop_codon:yes gene_type:complete
VIAVFPCGASAIMARATIARNATMIEIHLVPITRHMAIIAGITASDVITWFTEGNHIVVT